MTERELIDQLCDLRPEWTARRAEIHAAHIYTVDGAILGRELVEAVLAGATEPWVRAGFAVIERALETGTEETQSLVVVGLFEAMQGPAYHFAGPPDLVDGWLGPVSRAAWADLIEGWTGTGIRTIAAWRNVIVNGPRHYIALRSPEFAFVAELAHGFWSMSREEELARLARAPNRVAWSCQESTGEWTPTAADTERILAPVRPLAATRTVGPGTIAPSDVFATLVVDGAQGRGEITFGPQRDADNGPGRIAHHAGQLYTVDVHALLAAWHWITQR